jgi:DNA-binding NtrC family response regulator
MPTILIVDDEESIREVAAEILKKAGFTIRTAADAAGAEAIIASEKVDAAVFDVVLPGRGGLDLMMQVRADYPKLPVVVMSGKVRTDSPPFAALVQQFGGKMILAKPFTPKELVDSVNTALAAASA